jgi:molybdopterin adenylyltransferase
MLNACVLMFVPNGQPNEFLERSLAALEAALSPMGAELTERKWIPEESAILKKEIRVACDQRGFDLLFTIGGIGIGLRDRVPECTAELLEREMPGVAELIRLSSMQKSRLAALSRGKAGMRNATLIINMGSGEAAVLEAIAAVGPLFSYIFEGKSNPWV